MVKQRDLLVRPEKNSTLKDCDAMLECASKRVEKAGWSEILRWYVDQWLDKLSELRGK